MPERINSKRPVSRDDSIPAIRLRTSGRSTTMALIMCHTARRSADASHGARSADRRRAAESRTGSWISAGSISAHGYSIGWSDRILNAIEMNHSAMFAITPPSLGEVSDSPTWLRKAGNLRP
jgi:hypothetical protein